MSDMGAMVYYKILGANGKPCHGGQGVWSLPRDGHPGEWMPEIGDIKLCDRGYHVCRECNLIQWLGPEIYLAEAGGDIIESEDKLVCSRARLIRKCQNWDERTARLLACDVAERVLPVFEKKYPTDDRPRRAIEVARLFADGNATIGELAAARDAAWAAAGDAEWAAAGAAAWVAAWDAAWDAARAAAMAARDAAWVAAWDAAIAAWTAVGDAEWAAAGDAAWTAAWDAAGAARDAEQQWQTERLVQYLRGDV